MASRHGRIALQLTQWVGGTIIILMFIFILADYWMQHRFLARSLENYARRDTEGLKGFLASRPFEDAKSKLETRDVVEGYVGAEEAALAVFDQAGNVLFKSSSLPSDLAGLEQLSQAPSSALDVRDVKVAGVPMVVGVTAFESKEDNPVRGYVACLRNAMESQQTGLWAWGLRSLIVLVMIIGVMLAVRIPVKRFVVAPIDGLFMAAYAASRDDYERMPRCPVDNEFAELYDMFGRLMGHLSDTRTQDRQLGASDEDTLGEQVEQLGDRPEYQPQEEPDDESDKRPIE